MSLTPFGITLHTWAPAAHTSQPDPYWAQVNPPSSEEEILTIARERSDRKRKKQRDKQQVVPIAIILPLLDGKN